MRKMISLVNIAEIDDILLIIGGFVSINALLMSSKKLLLLKMRYFRWNLTNSISDGKVELVGFYGSDLPHRKKECYYSCRWKGRSKVHTDQNYSPETDLDP